MSDAEVVPEYEALTRVQLNKAQRRAAQWQSHVVPDREIPDLIGLSESHWQAVKSAGRGPRMFSIGRRVFCRTQDLRTWLDECASTTETAAA